jgi:hemolysin D
MGTESITVYFEALRAVAAITYYHETLVHTNSNGTRFLATSYAQQTASDGQCDYKSTEQTRAQARLDQPTLTAPIDGTVQTLSVTNRGQVVTTGQEVLRLVPDGEPLKIDAYISNDDIGLIAPRQPASVRIDSFPFTRLGMLEAEISEVAYDAIPADQANQALDVSSRRADPTARSLAPNVRPMTELDFETRLKPKALAIDVNGHAVPLTAGMTVSVEIKTGSRRLIEYVFSPLVEIASGAMRER